MKINNNKREEREIINRGCIRQLIKIYIFYHYEIMLIEMVGEHNVKYKLLKMCLYTKLVNLI